MRICEWSLWFAKNMCTVVEFLSPADPRLMDLCRSL